MSQPPPPPSQPPPLQPSQSPLHQSRHLSSSPFLAGRQQPYSAPSVIGTSNHRSPAGAGARGTVPAGESLAGIRWNLNLSIFSGDSVHFRSFEKEAVIFAEHVGFGHVLKDILRTEDCKQSTLRCLGRTDKLCVGEIVGCWYYNATVTPFQNQTLYTLVLILWLLYFC